MSNVPNTEYITVNKNGFFVGGKPATKYRGQDIYNIDYVQETFAWMQEQNPKIEEFHIGAFATRGKYAEVGNPLLNYGRHVWCRCVGGDTGALSSWVFLGTNTSAASCAYNCAYNCASHVRSYASFRSAVLGSAIDKQNVNPMAKSKNPEIEKLKTVDFSKLPKSPIELNGYRILVEKISTRTK